MTFSATAATQVSGECVKDWTGLDLHALLYSE